VKFLAVSTNQGDPLPHLAAEMQRMDELASSGVVERLLLKADRSGAVVLLDAPDDASASAALDTLPLVARGLTRFALTPLLEPAEVGGPPSV
jgi:hypothetical protein